nr:MAG: DNA binding protein [Microviridae sp.]
MFRKRANPRKDKRIFSKSASMVHKKNLMNGPMRGGIRL